MNIQPEERTAMETATEWLIRLRDESLTENDIVDWMQWYDRDERNRHAFNELQEFWHFSKGLAEGPDGYTRIQRLLGPHSAAQPATVEAAARDRRRVREGSSETRSSSYTRQGGDMERGPASDASSKGSVAGRPNSWLAKRAQERRGILRMAIAASILLVTVASWRVFFPAVRHVVDSPLVREKHLPDGSEVRLAAQTSVEVQYTAQQRRLILQGGEAHFVVAPNAGRPFVVQAGELTVQALGTAFNIRKAGERVVVTVDDGAVQVSSASSSKLRVDAGHEIKWEKRIAHPIAVPADPTRALAWQQGRLEYIEEPLSAVIADLNRYSKRTIAIGDAAVGELSFTGTIFTQFSQEWIEALPGEFPVDLTRNREGSLILTSR